jgi:hypothetical protein
MSAWIFLYIYLAGAVLVALRIGWHVRYQMDKYDRRYSDVQFTLWSCSLFWPILLLFSPRSFVSRPTFTTSIWEEGRAEKDRALDYLEQNPPPCAALIRYAPKVDDSGKCHSEFIFDAAEVEAVMSTRLAELPAEQHGRYSAILNWVRKHDASIHEPTDVPVLWHWLFRTVAVGMMKRGLGQVKCGECGQIIPQDMIISETDRTDIGVAGWVYQWWVCPEKHKLLTKDAMHFYVKKSA